MTRFKIGALCVVATALLGFSAFAGSVAPASAANQSQQGLVNVQIGDITTGDILSNNTVNLAVAANIAATVCGVTVPVAVLAQQLFRTGSFDCSGTTQSVLITQRR